MQKPPYCFFVYFTVSFLVVFAPPFCALPVQGYIHLLWQNYNKKTSGACTGSDINILQNTTTQIHIRMLHFQNMLHSSALSACCSLLFLFLYCFLKNASILFYIFIILYYKAPKRSRQEMPPAAKYASIYSTLIC